MECKNLDTYGIICVKCNRCGRFNENIGYEVQQTEPYCKLHRIKLTFVRLEHGIEIYYCSKCHKEYTEFPDISPIYWSNYEFIYNNEEVD